MKILSLCDGMSCGHIALERAGIEVEQYFAAEIKEIGIKVTKENYPDTIHIGDVNKISFKDGVLHTEKGDFEVGHIDLVMFGSPCQTFSVAMKADLRVGLENKEKSGLFLECHRILKEVNPTYFFMENVARMKEEDKNFISELMGVEPIRINSSLVSAQLRDRFYWTNIQGVTIPQDKGIMLQDILTSGYTDRKKARALLVSDSRPLTTKERMIHRYRNTGFTTLVWEEPENDDSVRYMNQTELERCQTVPEGYTKCLTRNEAADVLGDGWTVDVIAHIFTYMKKQEREEKEMELRVNTPTFPEVIEFNFEELKTEITERASAYVNLVYTEGQIQEAKKDRAALNKFVKALSDERIKVKKECLKPYEDFEAKIKELDGIVSAAIQNIDSQIKAVEEQEKAEKLERIKELWETIEHPAEMTFDHVYEGKFMNKSCSMATIKQYLENAVERFNSDLAALQNLPEFSFEAIEVYKQTLDMHKAISEGKRLAEIQKKKAEAQAEQERLEAESATDLPTEPLKQWVSFKALLTTEDAFALKDFFAARNIEFRPF